ncbi:MAG: hypothetical protein EXX96DRAFT_645840 [Benjaminiella poitrasii]|nr:MAG: hypothetical protein EXX96DRAFT_645840 [Benjaminiella poitrasii]
MSSKQTIVGASASKKIRMTMACERCRSKKVKCDFVHPQCTRCQQAKAQCSYDGSATQIDLFNLVKLNETVDILQKRVESMETDIKDVCSNTQYVANEVRMNRAASSNNTTDDDAYYTNTEKDTHSISSNNNRKRPASSSSTTQRDNRQTNLSGLMSVSNAQWSLSLTPKGLRIDTNIASLHDLYDILLSGVSQLDMPHNKDTNGMSLLDTMSQSSSSTTAPESPRPETITILRKKPLWKSRLKTFPLYSSWEPQHINDQAQRTTTTTTSSAKPSAIYSVDPTTIPDILPRETLQHLITIFSECFMCFFYPDPDNSIQMRFEKGSLEPLLANAVFAWTARHAAVYHNFFPGQDPNQVGEPFFSMAKTLIKERFMKTSIDTMYSLLIMYIYAIGIPSDHKEETESEAYIYLGLAIRMCLDLKMNLESTSTNPYEREISRRFFWVLYFLETLGSIHSDKPFSLPPRSMITTNFPTLMDHEQTGSHRYRMEFMIERFKITRIYRNIIYKTADEKLLLSQILAIDKELKAWYDALPSYFKYELGDIHKRRWDSTSFREQACIKLNFEYNYQLCQLYGIFVSKSDVKERPSTIEILSRDVCLKAARITIELLECWVQLKQLWCHFSLENLMMTTMIYGNILAQPMDQEQDVAKQSLKKITSILLSSPVRHHKYVLALVNRIDTLLKENAFTTPDYLAPLDTSLPQKENQTTIATNDTSAMPPPKHGQPPSLMQSIQLANHPFNPRTAGYNVLDVASASSAFDIHKTSAFSEEMHFSDFVYTPSPATTSTFLNYHAGMLSNVMSRAAYEDDKKQDYTTSEPYLQQQTYNYGYGDTNDANPSASTTTAVHYASSPTHSMPFQATSSTPHPPWLQLNTDSNAAATQPVLMNQQQSNEPQQQPFIRILSDFHEGQSQTYQSQPPSSSQVGPIPMKQYFNTANHFTGPYQ